MFCAVRKDKILMDNGKTFIPPIKIQGIKTKLVPLIKRTASLDAGMVWVEPFMGSGAVGFNIDPETAVFADVNPYIINFYRKIQDGAITADIVRDFLEHEGRLLEKYGGDYYYSVRKRFNEKHEPLDFLFLNRSCFNGMVRFNRNYGFNVPYGHKPKRFSKAYITKIVNQVKYLEETMPLRNWSFVCRPYGRTIGEAPQNSFIYCDPPYIGRHVDYYDSWDEKSEESLKDALISSGARFMLSTWDYNECRKNVYIEKIWGFCNKTNTEHFYYVGAKEINRRPVVEALLTNYPSPDANILPPHADKHLHKPAVNG